MAAAKREQPYLLRVPAGQQILALGRELQAARAGEFAMAEQIKRIKPSGGEVLTRATNKPRYLFPPGVLRDGVGALEVEVGQEEIVEGGVH